MTDDTMNPPGVDVPNVTDWLTRHVARTTPPLRFTRTRVGRSNLTYVVTDSAGLRRVLRRPPLSGRLPSAHDMGREFRIISALSDGGFRVPATFGFCDDPAVSGAEFYVMEHVGGFTIEVAADAEANLQPGVRPRAAMELIDTLAELHAIDVESVGLGDLARHHGYFERQLRRWHRQWQSAKTRELDSAQEAHDLLAAGVPEQQRVAIVHGDFRIDNVRINVDGTVLAVLDWELCTLGDPLADLGTVLSAWQEPDDPPLPFPPSPSRAEGFPPRSALIERYAERSGLDVSHVGYAVAFSIWKHAMIMEGVYTRYAQGAYGEVDPAVSQLFAVQAAALADAAANEVRNPRQGG